MKDQPETCHRCGSEDIEPDPDSDMDWCHGCNDYTSDAWDKWSQIEDDVMNERSVK
jgi:hypothetical protein